MTELREVAQTYPGGLIHDLVVRAMDVDQEGIYILKRAGARVN